MSVKQLLFRCLFSPNLAFYFYVKPLSPLSLLPLSAQMILDATKTFREDWKECGNFYARNDSFNLPSPPQVIIRTDSEAVSGNLCVTQFSYGKYRRHNLRFQIHNFLKLLLNYFLKSTSLFYHSLIHSTVDCPQAPGTAPCPWSRGPSQRFWVWIAIATATFLDRVPLFLMYRFEKWHYTRPLMIKLHMMSWRAIVSREFRLVLGPSRTKSAGF